MNTKTVKNSGKSAIMEALIAWVRQRPGFDLGNYDLAGYRSDSRKVTQQKNDAITLIRFVELRGKYDKKKAEDIVCGLGFLPDAFKALL